MPSTFSMACNALRNTGQVIGIVRANGRKHSDPPILLKLSQGYSRIQTKKASWKILELHEDGTVHRVTLCLLRCFLSLIVHKAITWVQVLSTLQRVLIYQSIHEKCPSANFPLMSCETLEAKNFDVEVETIGIAGGISRHLRLPRSSSKEFRWRFTARQISVEALCRKGYFQTNWRCRKGPARNSISMRSEELPSSCIKQIITAKINNNRTKKYQLRQSGIAQRLDASSPEDKHCWLFCV